MADWMRNPVQAFTVACDLFSTNQHRKCFEFVNQLIAIGVPPVIEVDLYFLLMNVLDYFVMLPNAKNLSLADRDPQRLIRVCERIEGRMNERLFMSESREQSEAFILMCMADGFNSLEKWYLGLLCLKKGADEWCLKNMKDCRSLYMLMMKGVVRNLAMMGCYDEMLGEMEELRKMPIREMSHLRSITDAEATCKAAISCFNARKKGSFEVNYSDVDMDKFREEAFAARLTDSRMIELEKKELLEMTSAESPEGAVQLLRTVADIQLRWIVHHVISVAESGEVVDVSRTTPRITFLRNSIDLMISLWFKNQNLFDSSFGLMMLRYSDAIKSIRQAVTLKMGRNDDSQSDDDDDFVDETHQLLLPEEGLIICYHQVVETPSCLYRWIITDGALLEGGGCDCIALKNELTIATRVFSEEFVAQSSRDIEFQEQFCRSLYDLLLGNSGEMESALEGREHLTFIPDGLLFRLPFCCLMSADGSYLIEKYSMSVSSSLRMMQMNGQQKETVILSAPPGVKSNLLCGSPTFGQHADPLQATAQELRNVAHSVSQDSIAIALVKEDFSPSMIQSVVRNSRPFRIHICSHGSQTDRNVSPKDEDVFQTLRVTGSISCAEDEVLSARLVASEFDLSSTDLVFLSCCSLGDGQLRESGMLGFYRACFQAGCPSVISALWSVYDHLSKEIASRFYFHHVGGGLDKAQALRQSYLDLLRSQPKIVRRCPVVWAQFVLFGNRF